MSAPSTVTPPFGRVSRGQRLSKRPLVIAVVFISVFFALLVKAVTSRNDVPDMSGEVVAERAFDISNEPETHLDFLEGKPFGIVDPVVGSAAPEPTIAPAEPAEGSIERDIAEAIERQRLERLEAERERREKLIERQLAAAEAALVAPMGVAGFGADADRLMASASSVQTDPGEGGGEPDAILPASSSRMQGVPAEMAQGVTREDVAAARRLIERESGAAGGSGSVRMDRFRLDESLRSPATPYEIKTGTLVPGIMVSAINSDLPGNIVGQVSQNVYDTESGRYVLIPQGTRLFGRYDAFTQLGQERLLIVWERLIYPDAETFDLRGMQGYDDQGLSGFEDRVNTHFLRTLGSAFLLSVVSAAGDEVVGGDDADTNLILNVQNEFGDNATGAFEEYLRSRLQIKPTIEIRAGYQFNIIVSKDLVFDEPYEYGYTFQDTGN